MEYLPRREAGETEKGSEEGGGEGRHPDPSQKRHSKESTRTGWPW